MKNRFSKLTVLALTSCMLVALSGKAMAADKVPAPAPAPAPAPSSVDAKEAERAYKFTDLLIVRPLGLVMTLGGAAVYIATLPVTTISGDAQDAQEVLVEKPSKIAFGRKH